MTVVLDCINFNRVSDKTRITILDHSGLALAHGNWFQDQILEYNKEEVIKMVYDPLQDWLTIHIRKSLFDTI